MRALPRRLVERASGAVEQRAGRASTRCSAAPGSRADDASPDCTRRGQHVAPARRRPTAKPTRSNSPGSIRSGCSDISPPSSAQPRLAATVGDTGDDLVDLFGHEPADRDVVEEEQRFGALHRDVVDRHRDAVDADGVVAVREPGDQRLRADAVGRRHEQRVAVAASSRRRTGPPKPPMSPTTSGRNVERTCSLMSSTAFSPAAMSTPASA